MKRVHEAGAVPDPALIAVIDDDEGMRVSLDCLLRSLGHRTALFECAEAFLSWNGAASADCIISDIHMPGMSGVELACRLAEEASSTPVILMSGFSDGANGEAARRAKVRCQLAKPFDDDTLIACLDEALVA